MDGQYHEASTLHFYTGVPLRVLHEPSGNLWYGSKFPDAPHVFETAESFAALWSGPTTVFFGRTRTIQKSCAEHRDFCWHAAGESLFSPIGT